MANKTTIKTDDIFTAEIFEGSRDFSPREKLKITDTMTAIRLDSIDSGVEIPVESYARIHVHNPFASEDVDYDQFVIIAEDGTVFLTGSDSFISSFMRIYDALKGSDEKMVIKVSKIPSKNRQGKYFLACALV